MPNVPRTLDLAQLRRVIEKNRAYLTDAARKLHEELGKVGARRGAPHGAVREALELYRTIRARVAEIESIERLMAQQAVTAGTDRSDRARMIADLDEQTRKLCEAFERIDPSQAGDCIKQKAAIDRNAQAPSEQWLRRDEHTVILTKNTRLLDELDYHVDGKPSRDARTVSAVDRGFTLFSLRGPAQALDAILPDVRLREHDIVERFSAGEIRGVLTHLRPATIDEIGKVFRRLLRDRFTDVKCLLVRLRSPDQLDERFLRSLDAAADETRPGEIRTIDLIH